MEQNLLSDLPGNGSRNMMKEGKRRGSKLREDEKQVNTTLPTQESQHHSIANNSIQGTSQKAGGLISNSFKT